MSEDALKPGTILDRAKPDNARSQLRLAIISTPRSGNTWARSLLATLFELEQMPVHVPDELKWDSLPDRCVTQIHWYPEESFIARLRKHGFRVVVMARHPLDVLMSWLNYVYYIHQEGYCPGGDCLDCAIVGASPRSEAFLAWAREDYAGCFLHHSPSWWDFPNAIRLRYEDLVADTAGTLTRVIDEIGERPRWPIADVVEANSIGHKKPDHDVWHFHFWQGQPGLWRELIPAAEARAIAAAIPAPFQTLGYACDPDESLEPSRADNNWIRLQLDSSREHLRLERVKHRKTVKDLLMTQDELERTRKTLRDEQLARSDMTRWLIGPSMVPRRIVRQVRRIATRVLRIDSPAKHRPRAPEVSRAISLLRDDTIVRRDRAAK